MGESNCAHQPYVHSTQTMNPRFDMLLHCLRSSQASRCRSIKYARCQPQYTCHATITIYISILLISPIWEVKHIHALSQCLHKNRYASSGGCEFACERRLGNVFASALNPALNVLPFSQLVGLPIPTINPPTRRNFCPCPDVPGMGPAVSTERYSSSVPRKLQQEATAKTPRELYGRIEETGAGCCRVHKSDGSPRIGTGRDHAF